MKLYEWTCPKCKNSFRHMSKDIVDRVKEEHFPNCKKGLISHPPFPNMKPVEKVDTIEIIS